MYKMLPTSLALATFASLALAQNTTVTVPEVVTISTVITSTSLATYATPIAKLGTTPVKSIKVEVGRSGFTFDPNNVQANVGDTISFHFNPKNHSVTQSSFLQPCQEVPGLNSGFRPTTVVTTNLIYNITIQDLNPLWFFCMQLNHCNMGMVFAVNPTTDKTFEAFHARALGSGTLSASLAPSNGSGSPTGTITGTDAGTGTATGENGASTSTRSNAISTSVNAGLTAVFTVVVVFILAL